MKNIRRTGRPLDGRIVLYRMMRRIALVVLFALAVKHCVFDIMLIRSSAMSPALMAGDRALLGRFAAALPMRLFTHFKRGDPVVFRIPRMRHTYGCLRIAALPKESVAGNDGVLLLIDQGRVSPLGPKGPEESLPPDFSPRDWFDDYRIPAPGETFRLDTLRPREFLFLASLLVQENPDRAYQLQWRLRVDDSLWTDYFINDPGLYRGPLDAVPADLANDWFFWRRVEDYLKNDLPGRNVRISFTVLENGRALTYGTLKRPAYFLIAHDWRNGFDSRYFGPVSAAAIRGKVRCVLWSQGPQPGGLRARRICKIVR
jgi:signal peptidase I